VMVDETRRRQPQRHLQHLQDSGIGGRRNAFGGRIIGLSQSFWHESVGLPRRHPRRGAEHGAALHNHMNETDVERVVAALEAVAQ